MKLLATFLILAALIGAGGWYAYKEGHLDSILGGKEEVADTAPDTAEPAPARSTEPEKPKAPVSTETKDEEAERIAKLYPMPKFPALNELVGYQFSAIPASVFPRDIQLTEPMPFEIRKEGRVIGKTTKPAGTKLVAIGQKDGRLVVATDAQAKVQSFADMKKTNLEEVITQVYDDWVKRRTDGVVAQRNAERLRSTLARSGDSDYRPSVRASSGESDPRFAPVVAAAKSGSWPEVKYNNIAGWRWGGTEKGYEVAIINYPVQTMFGEFDTEVKALIKGGKVERFVYTGSGEEVPKH